MHRPCIPRLPWRGSKESPIEYLDCNVGDVKNVNGDSSCRYRCPAGYQPGRNDSMRKATGGWSENNPYCEARPCTKLDVSGPDEAIKDYECSGNHGDVCTVVPNTGYTYTSPGLCSLGSWENALPECHANACEIPPSSTLVFVDLRSAG